MNQRVQQKVDWGSVLLGVFTWCVFVPAVLATAWGGVILLGIRLVKGG